LDWSGLIQKYYATQRKVWTTNPFLLNCFKIVALTFASHPCRCCLRLFAGTLNFTFKYCSHNSTTGDHATRENYDTSSPAGGKNKSVKRAPRVNFKTPKFVTNERSTPGCRRRTLDYRLAKYFATRRTVFVPNSTGLFSQPMLVLREGRIDSSNMPTYLLLV